MCAGKTGGVSGEGFMNVELILYVIVIYIKRCDSQLAIKHSIAYLAVHLNMINMISK